MVLFHLKQMLHSLHQATQGLGTAGFPAFAILLPSPERSSEFLTNPFSAPFPFFSNTLTNIETRRRDRPAQNAGYYALLR